MAPPLGNWCVKPLCLALGLGPFIQGNVHLHLQELVREETVAIKLLLCPETLCSGFPESGGPNPKNSTHSSCIDRLPSVGILCLAKGAGTED